MIHVYPGHNNQAYSVADAATMALTGAPFHAACGKCEAKTKVGNRRDCHLPVEQVKRLFERQGWIIGARDPKHNRCPDCLKPARKDAPVPRPQTPPPIAAVTAKLKPAPDGFPKAMPRDLTPREMVDITRLLDQHFDEKDGRYLNSWSDEKIAAAVDVPRACVERLRETGGWGKIRVFEDIEQLRADSIAIRAMLDDHDIRITAAERKRIGG